MRHQTSISVVCQTNLLSLKSPRSVSVLTFINLTYQTSSHQHFLQACHIFFSEK